MKNTTTLLIVDDEPMMRDLLQRILCRDGYKLLLAKDGKEALAVLEKKPVDIIISDVRMPRLDGLELLKIVRTKYPRISVIIMTAYGDTYTVRNVLLLGADEYITKPFKSFEMSLVVQRAYWKLMSSKQQKMVRTSG